MVEIERETNLAQLLGTVEEAPQFSHRSFGEQFYEMKLAVSRRSGYQDKILVIISERLMLEGRPEEGDRVAVTGQIRTYNKEEEGKNRLIITVFARAFRPADPEEMYDVNQIQLDGFLCKEPVRRTSPLGREICDLMVAVNRMYNKSYYIPCIAWGRNAAYGGILSVGEPIALTGRIQSREYKKRDEEGNVELRIAYEVSVLKIED
ncbi:MAG: single-stranded DNA-binding protein [Firmicutes bacterium]|nr:single-stranded DNA-binding protein [Bacillota bacterium]